MTEDQREVRRKKRVLEYAEKNSGTGFQRCGHGCTVRAHSLRAVDLLKTNPVPYLLLGSIAETRIA